MRPSCTSQVEVQPGGVRKKVEVFWRTFRELVGDDAYERYCEHHRLHHGAEAPLDRRAFYEKHTREKWSGIKRCC